MLLQGNCAMLHVIYSTPEIIDWCLVDRAVHRKCHCHEFSVTLMQLSTKLPGIVETTLTNRPWSHTVWLGNGPVWAQEHCNIGPFYFLAECHKRWLDKGSFVLHCLLVLSHIQFVYFPLLFCLSVSVKWLAVNTPPKWPSLCWVVC